MKTIKTVLITAGLIIIFSFTIKKSLFFEKKFEDIGIIKQSLLKPTQFNKTQKGFWILLNGQEITKDSELFKLLEENFDLNILTKKGNKYFLPNASGKFIRSSNINGEGSDPDKDRKVGSIQKGMIESHSHFNAYVNKKEKIEKSNNYDRDRLVVGDQTSSKPFGGAETRPINISMYTYIKISN